MALDKHPTNYSLPELAEGIEDLEADLKKILSHQVRLATVEADLDILRKEMARRMGYPVDFNQLTDKQNTTAGDPTDGLTTSICSPEQPKPLPNAPTGETIAKAVEGIEPMTEFERDLLRASDPHADSRAISGQEIESDDFEGDVDAYAVAMHRERLAGNGSAEPRD